MASYWKKDGLVKRYDGAAGTCIALEAVTSDFIYVRLYASRKLHTSEYLDSELKDWAAKIKNWSKDTYVYFDNDYMGCAPKKGLKAKRARRLLIIEICQVHKAGMKMTDQTEKRIGNRHHHSKLPIKSTFHYTWLR